MAHFGVRRLLHQQDGSSSVVLFLFEWVRLIFLREVVLINTTLGAKQEYVAADFSGSLSCFIN